MANEKKGGKKIVLFEVQTHTEDGRTIVTQFVTWRHKVKGQKHYSPVYMQMPRYRGAKGIEEKVKAIAPGNHNWMLWAAQVEEGQGHAITAHSRLVEKAETPKRKK